MNGKRLLPLLASFAILASACTQKNTGDEPNASTSPEGLDRFLLFPNPVTMNTGGFETNTTAYATAYYAAIDPSNAKDTLDKWRTLNGFGTGGDLRAVFRDAKDLGYGRNMNGRVNPDGSIAFYVENYNVAPNASTAGYANALNVEAAIRRDTRWHVGTNAIEWSAAQCGPGDPTDCSSTVKFAKFYNFSSKDGTRQLAVDLDGKGLKAMPGPCITCHGGRGDPLTPPDASTSKPRFPLVENSVSRKRGDVQGRLHGMNVDSFGFSPDIPAFSKNNQQATLKQFNQWILCTYPLAGAAAGAEDTCRIAAGLNEWQGAAAEMIKSWYGGNGMTNPSFADTYLPTGWSGSAADTTLYTNVVAPFCRTCHILRGTNNQNDIDFMTTAKFQAYADRIKAHVFDRGTMPLALIVYDDFWNSDAPNQLATFINPLLTPPQTALDTNGLALKPGRPVANPGPDRMVRTGTNAVLTGEDSLFAGSYRWSMVQGVATISSPNSMIASFNAPAAGTYKVQLTVASGSQTDSKTITITANDAFPDPAGIKFAHVKNVLQNISHTTAQATGVCADCHKVTALVQPAATPPIWYTNFDRNGNGTVDDTDDAWLAKAVQGRVNLTEITASPLLRKPTGNHHNGKMLLDVTDTLNGGLRDYSILYNWILAGMPPGGVAASPLVNGGVNPGSFIFSGPFGGPFTSTAIAMDASNSIGPSGVPLSFAWSLISQPAGGNAVITNPNTVNPTMAVQNVGDYVLQLQASGGGQTDTAQTRFTVTETPFTADFTPVDQGTAAVTFGAGNRGDIVLQSNTSVFATGSPVSCSWTVISGPGVLAPGIGAAGGPTLDGSSSLVSTKACIQSVTICIPFLGCFSFPVNASATLNVPSTALNGTYVVQFTASTVTSQTLTHSFGVAENPPVPSISVTSPVSLSFSGNPPSANISLSGSSTGVAPLTFAWSIDTAPGGSTTAPSITTGSTTSTLTAKATGSYTVRLTVTDANQVQGVATSTFTVAPSNGTTFATMTNDFVNFTCTSCHVAGNGEPGVGQGIAPSWVTNGTNAGDVALWQRVFARVTLGVNVNNSLLLLNPSNTDPAGHGGGCRPGFNTLGNAANTSPNFCPDTSSANYTAFRNWILNGAPPGN
jgi:hypothetical protein